MKAEIASIEREQRSSNFGGVVQVEVVNSPTVEIDEPLKVTVDENSLKIDSDFGWHTIGTQNKKKAIMWSP